MSTKENDARVAGLFLIAFGHADSQPTILSCNFFINRLFIWTEVFVRLECMQE
jgi:hypothetical protein